MKRVFLAVVLSIVATALYAQNFSYNTVFGFGFAGDSNVDAPNAQFALQAFQFQYGERSYTGGGFQLAVRSSDGVAVLNARVRELVIDGNTATISGDTMVVIRTRSGWQRVRGTVTISVADNRSRTNPNGDYDTISVSFQADSDPEGDAEFAYEGAVLRGDIVIYQRSR